MKVHDVKQIGASPVNILKRNDFSKYIELPCLEACLYLYDMNIHTFSSGCNEVNDNNAYIMLEYNYLSSENKIVADHLINKGLANKSIYNNEQYIKISIPTNGNDDVSEISNRLLAIVKEFTYQDLLYGFMTKDAFIKRQAEVSGEFNYINGELIPKSKNSFRSLMELERRKNDILFEINECFQDAIDDGIIDLSNNLVWENKELFQKHIDYIESTKGMGSK